MNKLFLHVENILVHINYNIDKIIQHIYSTNSKLQHASSLRLSIFSRHYVTFYFTVVVLLLLLLYITKITHLN